MSGIDFARSDLSPGLLCELVLKDEFTFQIPALEISTKTRGGGGALLYNRGYGCASGIFRPLPLSRQMAEIYTVFPRLSAPIRLQILISALVRVSAPPSDKRLLQISLDFDQKDGEPELFLIN